MTKTITTSIIGMLLFVGIVFLILTWRSDNSLAGVDMGSEYNTVLVTSADRGTTTIKSLQGSLGSIIISSTTPVATGGPVIAFYDTATTTVATTSLTSLIDFGSEGGVTPTAGTYTFDVAFPTGIFMWVDPSFNGNYTITYR